MNEFYQNPELSYEKLIFSTNLSGSSTFSSLDYILTVGEASQNLEKYMIFVRDILPLDLLNVLSRISVLLGNLAKSPFDDTISVNMAKDKNLTKILEILQNYLIPLSSKIIISNNVSDKSISEIILPSFILAESHIVKAYFNIKTYDQLSDGQINEEDEYVIQKFPLVNFREDVTHPENAKTLYLPPISENSDFNLIDFKK